MSQICVLVFIFTAGIACEQKNGVFMGLFILLAWGES